MANWVCRFEDLLETGKVQILQDELCDVLQIGIEIKDAQGAYITVPGVSEDFRLNAVKGNEIMISGNPIAYVAVETTRLSTEEAEKAENLVMTILGQMVELGYKRFALAHETKIDQSKIDGQTGTLSRAYFENRMEVLDRSEVVPVAVISGNINDWKYVNDKYGSEESARLISIIGAILHEEAKDDYLVGHCAGDVMNVLIPKAEKGEAEEYCARVRQRCLEFEDELLAPSIALGIATKENVEQNIPDVLSDAEYEMYVDKISLKKQPGYRERLTKGQK